MRSLLAAGLLAGTALASPGFAQDQTPGQSAEPAKAYDAATVLATVNGTEITLGHVIALRDRLPPQYQNLPDDVLLTGLLDQLVDQQLLADAQSASPETDPLQVKLSIENERRGALAGLAADAAVADAVDDAKVQAAYDKQSPSSSRSPSSTPRTSSSTARRRRRRSRPRSTAARTSPRWPRRTRATARRPTGGELGWFGAGQMVPEFETAVAAHARSARSPSRCKTQFGWHLIKLNEKRETTPPALDQARPEIENQLRQAGARGEARRAPRRRDDREARDRPAAGGDPRERPADQLRRRRGRQARSPVSPLAPGGLPGAARRSPGCASPPPRPGCATRAGST